MKVAVVILAVPIALLCLINLSFSLALARRLRGMMEELSSLRSMMAMPESGLAVGSSVPRLTAVDVDGHPLVLVSEAQSETLLAFFSAECSACRQHMRELVEILRSDDDRDAIVVVTGDRALGKDLVELACGLARIVCEDDYGPWASALEVRVFPTFIRLNGERVEAKGLSVADAWPTVSV